MLHLKIKVIRLTIEEPLKGQKLGPVIVSLANAARAFDAPVRYPILFNAPNVFATPMGMPKASAFITLIEHFFGLFLLLPILGFTRGFKKLFAAVKSFDKRDWFSLMYISFGGSALGLFFFLMAMGLGNPTIAILVQKIQPLITLIFAVFILKEKLSLRFYIALVAAIVGIVLMAMPDILKLINDGDYSGLIAILLSLLAATMWGGSTVFGRILTKKVDFWDLTLLRYLGGFIFLLLLNIPLLTYNSTYFGFLVDKQNVFAHETSPGVFVPVNWQWYIIIAILYFATLTGGVLPLTLYYFGLKRTKAAIAGLAELAFPVLAIIVNYYFLGYGLDWFQGAGALVLVVTMSILSFINAKESNNTTKTEQADKESIET